MFVVARWFRFTTLMACLLGVGLANARGQEMSRPGDGMLGKAGGTLGEYLFFGGPQSDQAEAMGFLTRIGEVAGSGPGRERSYTTIEAMPYGFQDDWLFLLDVRGFRSDNDRYGANLGGGVRKYLPAFDRIFGAYAFHDYDNTSGALFRQISFGLETYGKYWDARVNTYFPMGTRSDEISIAFAPGSARFSGNNLLYDRNHTFASAGGGLDMEVGVPLPGKILHRHDVRAYAGWYHFESASFPNLTGWKGRLQANLVPSISLGLEVTNDQVFHTNTILYAQWSFGGYRPSLEAVPNQFHRMTTPIQRNYNVMVASTVVRENNIVAVNPQTGNPYFIEHVRNVNNPGPVFNGTISNPFLTIQDAQASPGGDIIYVHADSVYNAAPNNTVVLEPNVKVLGEANGVTNTIAVPDIGFVPLPRATTGVNRPLFTNGTGDVVTLATNSEFSGFQIGLPGVLASGGTGNGIVGANVGNVLMHDVTVNNVNGDGVILTNTFGSITMNKVLLQNPLGVGLHVVGGSPIVTFSGDGVAGNGDITNAGARAVVVDGTAGGSVNLTGADVINTNGQGVLINNANGLVTLDQLSITNSTTTGLDIEGGSGIFTMRGPIAITNAFDDSIRVQNVTAAGGISFTSNGGVTISNRHGRGVFFNSNATNVNFTSPLTMAGVAAGGTGAGLDIQSNTANLSFGNVSISDSNAQGILIGGPAADNTGNITFLGPVSVAGNVLGNSVAIIDDAAVDLFNAGLTINGRRQSGLFVNNTRGDVTVKLTTTIDNTNGSTAPAVDIEQSTANVTFNALNITNATRPAAVLPLQGAGVNIQNQTGTVSLGALNVTTSNGIGLFADTATLVTTSSGTITSAAAGNVGRSAIRISNSGIGILLNQVNSAVASAEGGNPTNGIFLLNNGGQNGNFGSFVVTGLSATNATLLSTITNSSGSGIFATNTGNVSLTNFVVNNNGTSNVAGNADGITATNLPTLFVGSSNIGPVPLVISTFNNNTNFGIHATDVYIVTVDRANFTTNGNAVVLNNFSEVLLEANQTTSFVKNNVTTFQDNIASTYNWTVTNNFIRDNGSDTIRMQNGVGANDSILNAVVSNNGTLANPVLLNPIGLGRLGDSIVLVNWNGPLSANMQNNFFSLGANTRADNGFSIIQNSTTAGSVITIDNNRIASNGGGNFGINIVSAGPSSNEIGGNTIAFNGPSFAGFNNTLMQFDLASLSSTAIFNNTMSDTADGATAIQFTSITAPANVRFDGNDITIGGLFANLIEQGIIFQTVNGIVNLSGTQDNTLIFNNGGGQFVDFSPQGNGLFNGSFLLNGVTLTPN